MGEFELTEELRSALKESIEKRGLEGTIHRLMVPEARDDIQTILHLWNYPGDINLKKARVLPLIYRLSLSLRRQLYNKADPLLKEIVEQVSEGAKITDIISLDDLLHKDLKDLIGK